MVRFGKYLNQKKRTAFNIVTDNIPTAIYLFDFPTSSEKFAPKLRTILIQSQPVVQVRWNPVRKGSLTLCCGTQSVYIWSDEWHGESDNDQEEMAECIGVPASMSFLGFFTSIFGPHAYACTPEKFEAKDLRWAPDGKGIILIGKDNFCCAFEVAEEGTPS